MSPLAPTAVDALGIVAGLMFLAALGLGCLALAWIVFAPAAWRERVGSRCPRALQRSGR